MFKKILVCSDGSYGSLDAARLGASIAQKFGSEVLVLNVFDTPYVDSAHMGVWAMSIDQDSVDLFAKEQREAIEKRLQPIFEPLNLPCPVIQKFGQPVDGILSTAEEDGVDLIVIGSRGLRGTKEFFLGSVSSGVLHHAACPVLIVHGDNLPDTTQIRRILLASDGSECAQRAASVAVNVARKFEAALTVLNVCADISAIRLPSDEADLVSEEDAALYAKRLLKHVKQNVSALAEETVGQAAYHQEVGHPAETIVRFAEEQDADIIVLGSRGLGGFARMLLGSVSNYVAHHADCHVLVVR